MNQQEIRDAIDYFERLKVYAAEYEKEYPESKQAPEKIDLAIAALRTQIEPGWTKVSDNTKPENGMVCLIKLANAKYPIIGYYSKTYGCITSLSGGQYPVSLATHYHLLPEPPKESEE